MNKVFDNGYRIVTSYRNSKNYDTNWLSSGYSLWFLRESKYLNNARMMLNTSCAISGTGFLVHRDIIIKNNGWKHHLLTEKILGSQQIILFKEKKLVTVALLYYMMNSQLHLNNHGIKRLRWAKGFLSSICKIWRWIVKRHFQKSQFCLL